VIFTHSESPFITRSLEAFPSTPTNRWSGCIVTSRESRHRLKGGLEEIPLQLGAIIMKLLAKTPEERYQTGAAVERDLRRCLDDWETQGAINEFSLGEGDQSDRLLIPEKLYGRDREIATLLAAFDAAVASAKPQLVLVSGYSGIGKSSLVGELHKALVPSRGLFASGKFDQLKRDVPYATLGSGSSKPDSPASL
jgi:serine/threonine protein kinase